MKAPNTRKPRRRPPAVLAEPLNLRITVTQEEILGDLLYPASNRAARRRP